MVRPPSLLRPTSLAAPARRLFNETRVNQTTETGEPDSPLKRSDAPLWHGLPGRGKTGRMPVPRSLQRAAKPADSPFVGVLQSVTSPYLNARRLTGSSAKASYLFAGPMDLAAIDVGRQLPFRHAPASAVHAG